METQIIATKQISKIISDMEKIRQLEWQSAWKGEPTEEGGQQGTPWGADTDKKNKKQAAR